MILTGKKEIQQFIQSFSQSGRTCLPLYSQQIKGTQNQIFKMAQLRNDLVIVSTNIVETSVTIDNLKYLIDCGRVKVKQIVNQSVNKMQVVFISKS